MEVIVCLVHEDIYNFGKIGALHEKLYFIYHPVCFYGMQIKS